MGGGGVVVTNTVYNGMPTSLGIMQMLIPSLGRGFVADKPCASQYPSMSIADISDCATSPVVFIFMLSLFWLFKRPLDVFAFELFYTKIKVLLAIMLLALLRTLAARWPPPHF